MKNVSSLQLGVSNKRIEVLGNFTFFCENHQFKLKELKKKLT
jgi:hypothetical protein